MNAGALKPALIAGLGCLLLAACPRDTTGEVTTQQATSRTATSAGPNRLPGTAAEPMATADAAPAVAIGTAALFELPGMFTPDTSVADLRRHFGEHNVAVTEIDGAEGETMRGVRLFAGDPARTADVYFQDPATLRGLQTVAIRSPRSQWSLDGGVRIGMTLAELVAANRAPVTFYGFEWDYGGTVSDWNGGTFAAPLGRAARRNVQLQPRDEVDGFQRGPLPTGDNTFRSDDRKRPTIGDDVVVGAIGIGFARDDDR